MQYTEKELAKLIEDVTEAFTADLAKAEEELNASKSEVLEETSVQPVLVEEVLVKAEEESEQKEEAKEDSEESCDYDDEDIEEMHKMYSSMSKAELAAHHGSVQKALEHHGLAKSGENMQKSEETVAAVEITPAVVESKPEQNSEMELLKSEVEAQKAKNEELKKNLDVVTEFLSKLNRKIAPPAKAITSLDVIAKSEATEETKELTKSDVKAVLAKKVYDPTLSKSDREAINAFYLNDANIDSVRHLLK